MQISNGQEGTAVELEGLQELDSMLFILSVYGSRNQRRARRSSFALGRRISSAIISADGGAEDAQSRVALSVYESETAMRALIWYMKDLRDREDDRIPSNLRDVPLALYEKWEANEFPAAS